MHDFQREHFYIGGQWAQPSSGQRIHVLNPATAELLGSVPAGTVADVDTAVAAASAALPAWAETPVSERVDFCSAIADGLRRRADELASVITNELGSPLDFSREVQVGLPIRTFASMREAVGEIRFEECVGTTLILREPVGVIAAITPWNYPLHQIAAKVAPALAAGNAVVLKPSQVTPFNAFILAEVCAEVGLPAGVVNLVTGSGAEVGEALAVHPLVDMVSFTGSTRAGRRVGELAAGTVKRTALELGGKSANVILDDVSGEDLVDAVTGTLENCFPNSGQTCSALTRLLVPRDRLIEVEAIAETAAAAYRVGPPTAPEVAIGPIVTAAQRDSIIRHIRQGLSEGARVLVGGTEPPEGLSDGFYVRPTIFTGVTTEMTIAQEEIFGPVLCILPYDTEEEALAIANDSLYGLSGGVCSTDPQRALRFAKRVRTGMMHVNLGEPDPLSPFGGVKQSGYGREFGKFGVEDFQCIKSIFL